MKIKLDSGIIDLSIAIIAISLIMAILIDINNKADKAMLQYISQDSKEFLNIEGNNNGKSTSAKTNSIP